MTRHLASHPFRSKLYTRSRIIGDWGEAEWFVLRLASTTRFRDSEPKSITKARARLASAEITRDHLLKNGLIPLFDSFDFEGLFLRGFNNGR